MNEGTVQSNSKESKSRTAYVQTVGVGNRLVQSRNLITLQISNKTRWKTTNRLKN